MINPASGFKAVWSTFSKLFDSTKPHIPSLLENGSFLLDFESRTNLLDDYFSRKCCTVETSSALLQFVANDVPNLQNCEINKTKLLNHIRNFDSCKSHGCDDMSLDMIKLCGTFIVKPLCIIFERCVENGVYPSSSKGSYPHKKKSPI